MLAGSWADSRFPRIDLQYCSSLWQKSLQHRMPPAKVASKSDCVAHHCRILPAFASWVGTNVEPCLKEVHSIHSIHANKFFHEHFLHGNIKRSLMVLVTFRLNWDFISTCLKRFRCRMRMSGRVHRLSLMLPCWSCLQCGHRQASSGASWNHFGARNFS